MYRLLQKVRVLELGQVIAGTYPGLVLGDLGAEVIKVEPFGGESGRQPNVTGMRGDSATALTMNRGKQSVVINLRDPVGREVFLDLVRHADVVLDNYRPGVMERLGIDFASLRQVNPRIVCCSVQGFAASDPRSQAPSYDLTHQAISGLISLTGEPDQSPVRVGIPLADLGSGLFAAIGILAALFRRQETGEGEQVQVAMYDSMVALMTYIGTMFLSDGTVPTRMGTAHEHVVPWQVFPTGDGYVVLAIRAEQFWPKLCDAIERPDWIAHPDYADNSRRLANRTHLVAQLSDVLRTRPTAEWMERFMESGVPASPVNTVEQAFADPYIVERMVVEYDHPKVGRVRLPGNPVKFPHELDEPSAHAPLVGEHTQHLLTTLLGYTQERVHELVGNGIVGTVEQSTVDA